MRTATLALLMLTLLVVPAARAQHDIGNGGDPLMLIFAKAKYDAAHMLETLDTTAIPASVDARARAFLIEHARALAADVRASEHVWHEGDVFLSRCAATNRFTDPTTGNPSRPSDVHLSLRNCRAVLLATAAGESEAVRTLIHEAAHHFGVGGSDADEAFASLVANVVYNLWLAARDRGAPRWSELPLLGTPDARYLHTAVWTGEGDDPAVHGRVLVWGGCNLSRLPSREDCAAYLSTGAQLELGRSTGDGAPPRAVWHPMRAADAPLGRAMHTAVWTGAGDVAAVENRMLVFGGCRGDDVACDQAFAVTACPGGNGAGCDDARKNDIVYDPATDTWSAASADGAPSPRVLHTALWTGRGMLVWGGLEGYRNATIPDRALGDGGYLRFDAAHPEGQWEALPATGDAPSARFGHTAVWMDGRMLVWGGCERAGVLGCARYADDGAEYDPATRTWRRLPAATGIGAREGHTAVATGRYMIVWGGRDAQGPLASGGVYDTVRREWLPTPRLLPPGETGRQGHTAVWDGLRGRMVVWGGTRKAGGFPTETLVLELGSEAGGGGRWRVEATDVAPIGRKGHAALWARDALVVWGGFGDDDTFLYTGGVFAP